MNMYIATKFQNTIIIEHLILAGSNCPVELVELQSSWSPQYSLPQQLQQQHTALNMADKDM